VLLLLLLLLLLRDDYKEGERKKLADLVRGMAAGENSRRASSPKMAVLNLQVGWLTGQQQCCNVC
jgi:hypothetical protein